jgi:hypothetical protein
LPTDLVDHRKSDRQRSFPTDFVLPKNSLTPLQKLSRPTFSLSTNILLPTNIRLPINSLMVNVLPTDLL